MSYLISEGAAPSTPATGKVAMYAKTDGRVYGKDDVGTEFSMSGRVSGAPVSASGTSIEFSNIPPGINQITVIYSGLSTTGTSPFLLQIGDSGGIENTGYSSEYSFQSTTPTISVSTTTAGYGLHTTAAASTFIGSVSLFLLDSSTNTWVATGQYWNTGVATTTYSSVGSKALSATLDRIRLTTIAGTDTFDAGTVNIIYG